MTRPANAVDDCRPAGGVAPMLSAVVVAMTGTVFNENR